MAKGVKLIAALMEDEHDDRLLDATRRLCSAFSDLLNAAQPENKEVNLSLDLLLRLCPQMLSFVFSLMFPTFLIAARTADESIGPLPVVRWGGGLYQLNGSLGSSFPFATIDIIVIIIDDDDNDDAAGVGFCIARQKKADERVVADSLTMASRP